MFLNSIDRIASRIDSIEKRFSPKPQVGEFSRQLSEAVRSDSAQSLPRSGTNALEVEKIVRSTALRHGVNPELALAVARTESNLSQDALSPVGAVGVMQLMPETAQSLGVRNIHDLRDNIDGGVRYLKQMQMAFSDDQLAVAAYNAGPGAIKQYGGVPPYAETQNYVSNVFSEVAKGK